MRTPGPKTYFAVLIAFLGTMSNGRAQEWLPVEQWIHLYPIEWELTSKFDGSWERSIRSGQTSREREMETGLRLKQRGDVLDRRIATFDIEVEPVTSTGRFTSATTNEDREGDFLNYVGSASILHGTPGPVSFTAHMARATGTTEGSLGARTESTNEDQSVAAHWKTRVFPTTLSYEERFTDSTFRSGLNANSSKRDDAVRTITLKGRSSKMDASIERASLDDRIPGRDRDFNDTRGRLNHRLRWGKGSRLYSRLHYFDRNGFNPSTRLNLDESAHIQHTKNLTSDSSYQFASTKQTVTTTSNSANINLRHKLYDSLTTNAGVSGSLVDSDFSESTTYNGNLGVGYSKRIPWGGTFSAGVGGGYGISDNKSQQTLLDVIDESQVVPATLIVVLDSRFIDVTTIVVTDAASVVTFTEGVDYTVAPTSGDLTELRIILAGGISAADTILVSYKFQSLPSLKFSTRTFNWQTGLNFGWISVFHNESRSDQNLISGAGGTFLTDDRDNSTGIELEWDEGPARARASGEKRFRKTSGFETDSLEFNQSLSYRFSRDATLAFGASESFTEGNNRDTDFYNGTVSLFWQPIHGLTIRPNAELWLRKDKGESVGNGERFERFKGVGIEAHWNWRKIEVRLRYNHDARKASGGTDTVEDRITLTMVRRSF